MKLRTKITILFILTVSSILLVAFSIVYWLRVGANREEFYNRLLKKAYTTAEFYVSVDEVNSTLLKKIDRTNKDILHRENITIYDEQNRQLYTSNDSIEFKIDKKLLQEVRETKELKFQKNEFEIVGIPYKDKNSSVVVVAGADDIQGERRLQSLKANLTWLYFISLLFVGVIGWFFSGRILQPINEVIAEIDTINSDNLEKRLSVSTEDEIGKLSAKFNQLLERIQQTFKLQQHFISNFSHELKNPLMKMASQIEVSLLRERKQEEYQQTLSSVLEDLKEFGELSDSLLNLSKIQHNNKQHLSNNIRIDEILFDAREEVIKSHPDFRVSIDVVDASIEENELIILGNSHLLRTAFVNLMVNGCKFSDNHLVKIAYRAEKQNIIIVFKNDGIGISSKDLPYIFEPFYRANNTSKFKGYGIGLSIVQQIIQTHKGTIQVKSIPEVETTFKVELPLNQMIVFL